jgi:hypothetical protein
MKGDEGPLIWTVVQNDTLTDWVINVMFQSSVIEDASPPECQITWNRKEKSEMPSCDVYDSREGYHMTHFIFQLYKSD